VIEAVFYALEESGDNMKITVPFDFGPRVSSKDGEKEVFIVFLHKMPIIR